MTVRILIGDVRDRLRELPADHFDCVVTSPPYWGLRDYGVEGQIGLELTLGEHLAVMVDVFREVRRVLKPTGTLWLNYGDAYCNTDKWGGGGGNTGKQTVVDDGRVPSWEATRGKKARQNGFKPKDLYMIPNRLAIALQEDGWWVRSEIIWAKPNPMPESIKDRPASAHEKIFMLTKSGRYFFAADDVKQPVSDNTHARISQDLARQEGSHRSNGGGKTNGPMRAVVAGSTKKLAAENQSMIGQKASREAALSLTVSDRNLRNFEPAPTQAWLIPTVGFSEAHFATFPPELVERCLKAGCPKGGTVLDPFGGAGTTALVADQMQLDATIIELNPDYVHIAVKRIEADRGAIQNALDPLELFGGQAA